MITGDMGEFNSLTGYLEGLSRGMASKAYIASVLEYSHALMTEELDSFVDDVAQASPLNYHHVYEWPTSFEGWSETVGVKQYRLWQNTLTGPAGNKVASYRFKASKRTVPVNPKLKKVGVVDKVHIFYLKATVFELGLQTTVRPVLSKSDGKKIGLSFISTRGGPGFGEPIFIPGEGAVTQPSIPSGEKRLQGKFNELYALWWGAEADVFFEKRIAPKLARDIPVNNMIKRRSGTPVGLKVADDNTAVNNALARLKKNQNNYIAGAQARRDLNNG